MNTNKTQTEQLTKDAVISSFFYKILYKYVDWERLWYSSNKEFKEYDKVKPNWKAKVFFRNSYDKKKLNKEMVVEKVEGNFVYILNDFCWNKYWLTKV